MTRDDSPPSIAELEARALEQAADDIDSVKVTGRAMVTSVWLRNRAQSIRERQ